MWLDRVQLEWLGRLDQVRFEVIRSKYSWLGFSVDPWLTRGYMCMARAARVRVRVRCTWFET
jgi:hypothetical protein